jgi:uridine phosphorylase
LYGITPGKYLEHGGRLSMIVHITTWTAWEAAAANGTYLTDSLDSDGFIHCSTIAQLLMPANDIFRGQSGLVLLCIEPALVKSPIIYEDCYQSGHAFPHIYGPLEATAVIQVVDFPPNRDGLFYLPPELAAMAAPHAYPILEYDPAAQAIIEPSRILDPIDIPEHCLLCFFWDVIAALKEAGQVRQIFELLSEAGPNPVYQIELEGRPMALTHPGVGAPMSAFFLDELIAHGCRKFIACGAAGVLDAAIDIGHLIIPDRAVRDEGTSYHYLPPAREVLASPSAIDALEQVLTRHQIEYVVGRTWTTDGFYRETPARMARRRAEGCLTVEMESAAFFAVAELRGATFGQILYGGDDLSGENWDARDWDKQVSTREKLLWLAAEACLAL